MWVISKIQMISVKTSGLYKGFFFVYKTILRSLNLNNLVHSTTYSVPCFNKSIAYKMKHRIISYFKIANNY